MDLMINTENDFTLGTYIIYLQFNAKAQLNSQTFPVNFEA